MSYEPVRERRYIFLDNWVLSNYTHDARRGQLSAFLHRNDLTIAINSLSLTELYNPNGKPGDRVSRATSFLAEHSCVIVNPANLFRAELQSYPDPLLGLPLELDLADLKSVHRAKALEFLLRRDDLYLRQGKDVAKWARNYETHKATWLSTVEKIIQDACEFGILRRDRLGRFVDLESTKEKFLLSLDRRHFESLNSAERRALGTRIVNLFLGDISTLPSIRLSSFCFWYAYVNTDQSNALKRKGSDIGDLVQLTMLPYCALFTVDNSMYRLLNRVRCDIDYSPRALNGSALDRLLSIESPGVVGS